MVGGTDADLDALEAALPDIYPRKRATRLKTEGAFHTYLMVAAAREFRVVLDSVEFGKASCQVLSNYTGAAHEEDPDSIRTRLFFQLFNPVDWVGCMQTAAASGVTKFIEFGGGIGNGDFLADAVMNDLHAPFECSGTNPQKCDAVPMGHVHIGLNFKNKS